MSRHYVYILECKDQSLYTGYTTDIDRRLKQHSEGKGAKYTRGRGPFKLMYKQEYPNKSAALRGEAQIKKLSSVEKRKLVERKRADGSYSSELFE